MALDQDAVDAVGVTGSMFTIMLPNWASSSPPWVPMPAQSLNPRKQSPRSLQADYTRALSQQRMARPETLGKIGRMARAGPSLVTGRPRSGVDGRSRSRAANIASLRATELLSGARSWAD